MKFNEFLQGVYSLCSLQINKKDFLNIISENFLKDSTIDGFKLLTLSSDYHYKIYCGSKNLSKKYAKYLYNNRDIDKFCDFLREQFEVSNTIDMAENWLKNNNITYSIQNIEYYFAIQLEHILENLITSNSLDDDNRYEISNKDKKIIEDIKKLTSNLSSPIHIDIPKEITSPEDLYINELMAAYADAENLEIFTVNDFSIYSKYKEDLEERRIDYFAAESIRVSTRELDNQFNILKNETYEGIKDTYKKRYVNGYERMLTVMEKVVDLRISTDYILGFSTNWLNNKIKKGVCHHLVNDSKLKWIKK